MINPILIIALLIATAVPVVVMFVIHKLDLYGTGSFRTVIMCFAWGLIAFGISYGLNSFSTEHGIVTYDTFVRFTAPVVEEIFKGLILLYLIRRTDFTYFVDGAIYGFAAGIGFAVIENYSYIFGYPQAALGVAVSRVISTNLVHATASGSLGIALGLTRFQRGTKRLFIALGGLLLAIAFHMAFNNVVDRVSSSLLVLYAAAVGFTGTGIIVFAIRRGITEEKAWVDEKIHEIERVTSGEAELAKRVPSLRELLSPVAEKFGEEKARQSEKIIMLQARLGIYQKTLEKLPDEKMRQSVESQMESLHAEMEVLRQEVGAYCMLYLRGLFPEGVSPLWNILQLRIGERMAARPESGGTSLWATLDKRATQQLPAATRTDDEP
jgi:RsiW-degrading membrane proteinase PrsW (M82 family)